MVENLDLNGEVLDTVDGGVLLEDHDITNTRHVGLDKTLDVETNVVTADSLFDSLVVHFDGEDLTVAGGGGSVGGEENNLITRSDNTLLDTASEHITDTLDLVDSGDGGSHDDVKVALGDDDILLKSIEEGVDMDSVVSSKDITTSPPGHVGGWLDQVVTHPARDREDRDRLVNEVLLPADTDQHASGLILDFVVTGLLVSSNVTVHLVHTNNQLLDTQQVNEEGVLASLTLDLSGLVVTLGNGGGEVTVSRNHEESNISLRGTSDHVLDEISMARGIDDGVVLGLGEELFGGASDGDTTLSFFLLPVHVESKSEGTLSEAISLFLELGILSLRDTAELEDQTTSSGGLTSVDMSADDNGNVLLAFGHCENI